MVRCTRQERFCCLESMSKLLNRQIRTRYLSGPSLCKSRAPQRRSLLHVCTFFSTQPSGVPDILSQATSLVRIMRTDFHIFSPKRSFECGGCFTCLQQASCKGRAKTLNFFALFRAENLVTAAESQCSTKDLKLLYFWTSFQCMDSNLCAYNHSCAYRCSKGHVAG